MAQFQFKEGALLNFGKVQFEIHPDDPDFLEVHRAECRRLFDMSERVRKSSGDDAPAAIREACNEIIGSINSILGEGAVEEIFNGRAIGFYDLVDVFNYITEEINAYKNKRQAEAVPVPQNREQRRAAAKASKPTAKKIVNLSEGEQA